VRETNLASAVASSSVPSRGPRRTAASAFGFCRSRSRVTAAADPTGIAVFESLTGNLSGVESMDYVRAGQVIRLGPHQTIVLSYMASCVRETITGGTVTVGTQRSEVQSGHVRRIEGHCYSGRMELTGEEAHVGGRVFRGPAH
jgi:hypothetical protein